MTYFNFLAKNWRFEVWFKDNFDFHSLTSNLTNKRNNSEWETDIFGCAISNVRKKNTKKFVFSCYNVQ